MKDKFAVLAYDDVNVIHVALAAGLDPSVAFSEEDFAEFKRASDTIFTNAKFLSDDFFKINQALVNGDIYACFTAGTYTASTARMEGHSQIRGVTPRRGPVDGKGGLALCRGNLLGQ